MAIVPKERKSLLSSQARIQAPWVKVSIGSFTFGVFNKASVRNLDNNDFYTTYNIQYPNYIQSLNIVKINGQINQYTLRIDYPVRSTDDPNFFEKVFSSVSGTRKIIFSYGDASMPTYVYKDEEAIITKVQQTFDLQNCKISYTVYAVSSAVLSQSGNFTFVQSGAKKPSTIIKNMFKNPTYGLQSIFTGMSLSNLDSLIAGDDKAVEIPTQVNISPLDYISYLVSCMIPAGSVQTDISKDIYVLTLHDDTVYDKLYNDTITLGGPYFKVTRTSYSSEQSDAYEVDVGITTSTIVSNFSIENNENYSIYFDYAKELYPEQYVRRINNQGKWEDVYAPTMTSKNEYHKTTPEDVSWYTKITKYPISAQITIQGLLRPATLMQYLRLNVIFPGGHKHIASGLYIVTKQTDQIDGNGYRTTLALTKIGGDNTLKN